ncbi:MAG: hypothetical protein Q7T13_17080 [Polaromonas sp.]|nr:hypothetical protein [Polaromonas sp.]
MTSANDYEELRVRHVHDMQAGFWEAVERLDWPASKLRAERERRLRHLLRVAKRDSPWHARRLRHIDPESFSEEQLEEIPPMTKDDLMDNFDEIVTDRRITRAGAEAHIAALTSDAYLLDRYHATTTGGSSLRRGLVLHDWDGWAEGSSGFARYIFRRFARPGEPPRRVIGSVLGAQHPMHVSSAMPQTFSDPQRTVWHRLPLTLPLDEIAQGLNQVQPELLMGYPTMLHQLSFLANAGKLAIAPHTIVSGAEPLLPESREAIERAWPTARLFNFWGMSEAFPAAFSCATGRGMHLSDDLVIVEPVDTQGRRVAPGVQSAKLYVTNLYNPTPQPIIRYEITDEVTLIDEPCACGSAHRRIEDVQGRLDDRFLYEGEITLHPIVFKSLLGREVNIVEYQVRQTPHGADVAIRCNRPVDTAMLATGMRQALQKLGMHDPQVTVITVDRIERQQSGKLKRFVPL